MSNGTKRSTLSLTSALDWGGWSTPHPGPVHIVQEAGWAPQPVRTGTENLAPPRTRFPDRPTRAQSR
jgi:hypothetical protein